MHQQSSVADLRVAELWIYPVKSLGGIAISQAKVLAKGFEYDRRWMLIDAQHQFITQRVHHQLALIKLWQDAAGFMLHYGSLQMLLPLHQHKSEPIDASIWNDTVEVFEVSDTHSAWFSEILQMPCKLVFFPDDKPRPVDADFALNDDQVSLADGYPILIIGQASLHDLNSRLKTPVPMNRFRPNIVFEGGQAFEEDDWKRFTIGDTSFAGVKPCARCVVTTVDQETGAKGVEPLATLSKYRKYGNKVLFGQNVLPLSHGNFISIGNEIKVTSSSIK
jgi:uncharacterized protein YcbX